MNQSCACRSVSGVLLLTALCGVFSTSPTHAEEDVRRATPPPGKALVFVFRMDRVPLAVQVPVIMNSVVVGELADGTFVTATVGPGRNYLRIGDGVLSTLDVAANESYFVQIRALGNPPSVRTEMTLLSETEGRRLLAQSRLAGVAPAAVTAAAQAIAGAGDRCTAAQALASTGDRCIAPQTIASAGNHCSASQTLAVACCNTNDRRTGDVHLQ